MRVFHKLLFSFPSDFCIILWTQLCFDECHTIFCLCFWVILFCSFFLFLTSPRRILFWKTVKPQAGRQMSTPWARVPSTAIHDSVHWISSLSASHYLFLAQNTSTVYLPETFLLEISESLASSCLPNVSAPLEDLFLLFHRKDAQASPFPLWASTPSSCSKILHLWVTLPGIIYPELLLLKKPDVLIICLSQLTFSIEEIHIFQYQELLDTADVLRN